ncbi:hypothetical protein ACJRO7_015402 [Eucalyptus globulus]|uniref:TIR domain-containing protein n=1 Tax=Eucalyptus globulus TaxID=34317 RepID=A0ABD3L7A2_EUCGL
MGCFLACFRVKVDDDRAQLPPSIHHQTPPEMKKPSGYDYEVFLSFRGPDTRMDITDYLYTSMNDAGIRVYRDDEELRIGEEIGDELLRAIEQSKISIPIFSKGYADSTWCLRELVKMVESKNTRGQKIMPIFYDVTPSEVKHQTKYYRKAIVSHAKKRQFDDETIHKWKDALKEVGALKGWDLQSMRNRGKGKGEIVKEVVNNVLTELKTAYVEVSDCFVKVDKDVDEIMRMIGAHNDETKIVGIHGIGGVGKTTLAKFVFNQLSQNFNDHCFLCDIRKTEITRLQSQLISNILKMKWHDINNVMEGKKVIKERLCFKTMLLLLDDVDDASQLDALVQKHEWFGKGSKIIITTRDRGILKVPTLVDEAYELNGMNFNHSFELFSKHAFRTDYPIQQYISHSERAVKICRGLPLALEVIGSLLSGKSIDEWEATLNELEKSPPDDVGKKLMISIEALNENQRNIFLDVACFFIGCDKRIVIHMWESCNFRPHQSLPILQQRSLIKIREKNQLWMHDWLRNIGRDFIQERSGKKPEKQQWVWTYEQALDVLEKMQNGGGVLGIGSIEAICLEFDELSRYSLIEEFLTSLPNLRFLRVDKKFINPQVDCRDFNRDSVSILTQVDRFQYHQRSNFLQTTFGPIILPELRWLSWNYFPTDFELHNFSLRKLVILDFSMSKITEEWEGWSNIKMAKNLKVLNLTGCKNLCRTPDLSSLVNLEGLILKGCRNLVQIDPSIGHLKRLVFLNLKDCYHLRMLPNEIGELVSLEQLLLDSTSIEAIPEWRLTKKLKILSLVECKSLNKLNFVGCASSSAELLSADILLTRPPKSIANFNSLTVLDLSCSAIEELPNSIGNLKNLKVLKMRDSSIRKLPSAIGMLEKLEQLEIGGLSKLGGELPHNIGKLPFLRRLLIYPCRISAAPQLPESLIDLCFTSFSMKMSPKLSNLLHLKKLYLFCPKVTTLSPDITCLSQLKELRLYCDNLQCLPKLPTNLSYLWIGVNKKLKTTNDLSHLKSLLGLVIKGCEKLTEIQGLQGLESLRSLELNTLPSLAKLPHLSKLKELNIICLEDCPKLFELRCGLNSLELRDINHSLKMLLATSGSEHLHIQLQQKEFDPITVCKHDFPLQC